MQHGYNGSTTCKKSIDLLSNQADETTLKVQDGAKPNVCHTGYLWGIHGPPKLIWYHYAEGRAGDVPKELLAGYQGGALCVLESLYAENTPEESVCSGALVRY